MGVITRESASTLLWAGLFHVASTSPRRISTPAEESGSPSGDLCRRILRAVLIRVYPGTVIGIVKRIREKTWRTVSIQLSPC